LRNSTQTLGLVFSDKVRGMFVKGMEKGFQNHSPDDHSPDLFSGLLLHLRFDCGFAAPCSFAAGQCFIRVLSVAKIPLHSVSATRMKQNFIIANGREIEAQFPCSLEEFLVRQKLLPRSVVVEHNGEAVAPSEFAKRPLAAGDRLEIVKIVAGG
jgi:thiamine biosynthesis protein ThiS